MYGLVKRLRSVRLLPANCKITECVCVCMRGARVADKNARADVYARMFVSPGDSDIRLCEEEFIAGNLLPKRGE